MDINETGFLIAIYSWLQHCMIDHSDHWRLRQAALANSNASKLLFLSINLQGKGHSCVSNQKTIFMLIEDALASLQFLIKINRCIRNVNIVFYLRGRFSLAALSTSATDMHLCSDHWISSLSLPRCKIVCLRCSGYAYSVVLISFSFDNFQLAFEHEISSDRFIDRLMPYFSSLTGLFSVRGDWTSDHHWILRSRHSVKRKEKPPLVNRAISGDLYFLERNTDTTRRR